MINTPRLLTAVALALSAAAANASDATDIFSVRGYGTLAGTYSDVEGADFVAGPYFLMTGGVGESGEFSFETDSKVGLQIDMQFNDRLSGVVQLVSEGMNNSSWDGKPNDEFVPSLEWANLAYKVSDNVTVRAGRIVLPFLMSSASKKIGFANH